MNANLLSSKALRQLKSLGVAMIVAAALIVAIGGGVALAAWCSDPGVEAGPNNGGGSVTNCRFEFSQNSSTMYINVKCAPVSYGGYKFGCNQNSAGQGYRITGVQFYLKYPNGYKQLYRDCNNHYMSPWQDIYRTLYTFEISKDGKDDGWYCIEGDQYWRNHYCSMAYSNYSSTGDRCFYIEYKWSASAWSWNNGSVKYPGDTIYWTHQVKNNGPSTVKNGDLGYRVDGRDAYNDGSTIRSYDVTDHINVGRLGSGSSVYNYQSKGPLTQSDVGKQYCQRVHYYPTSVNSGRVGYASWSCTKVPYDYTTVQYSNLAQINEREVTSNKVVKPKQTVRGHYHFENYSWSHTKTLEIGWQNGLKIKRGNSQIGSLGSSSGTFREGYFNPGNSVNSWRSGSPLPSFYAAVPETTNWGYHVDADDRICAWMQTDYRNYAYNYGAGGYLGSNRYTEDCATVPYHYPGCSSYGYNSNCTNKWDSPDPTYNCAFEGSCDGQSPKSGTGVQPTVGSNADSVLEGDAIRFTYSASNNGPSKTKSIGYTIRIFRLRRGYSLDSAQDNSKRLFGYDVAASSRGVNRRMSGKSIQNYGSTSTGNFNLSWNGTWSNDKWVNTTSMSGQTGDLICSYIVLNRNWAVYEGRSSNTWLSSNVKCVRIGKRPQMQINGSDAYAAGGFIGQSAGSPRGSYTQYAQLTGGGSSNTFGSAGRTPNNGNWYQMIFANSWSASANATSNLYAAGLTSRGNDVKDIDEILAKVRRIRGDRGKKCDFNSDDDSGNVYWCNGDVNISSNVSHIHATIISGGRVYTCSGSGRHGSNDMLRMNGGCNNRLVIDGAVVSRNSPVFHRTWGGGNTTRHSQLDSDSRSATAEKINYTPDVWLNSNWYAGTSSIKGYTVDNVVDLPTRY